MFEKRYLFSSASERHCKQYMETKRLTPFFISAKLIRFVMVIGFLYRIMSALCSDVSEEQTTYTTWGKKPKTRQSIEQHAP